LLPHRGSRSSVEDRQRVGAKLYRAARDPGHDPARRILCREHYRLFYQRNPTDVDVNPEAAQAIFDNARGHFGDTNVYCDAYTERNRGLDFPVQLRDGQVVSCLALSDTLRTVPVVAVEFVSIEPRLRADAEKWLRENRAQAIAPRRKEP
jgi:hypothetical protein